MAVMYPSPCLGCSLFSEENMPIIVQKAWYTRAQLQSQPSDLFAWGDNLARVGGKNNPRSGQAYACRDEPNAVGIPTKLRPSMDADAFFSDADRSEEHTSELQSLMRISYAVFC